MRRKAKPEVTDLYGDPPESAASAESTRIREKAGQFLTKKAGKPPVNHGRRRRRRRNPQKGKLL